MQMVDCVLTGLSGSNPEYLALPKCGVWIHLVRNVTMESLEWRWSEDLAISGLRCILICLKCMTIAQSPTLHGKETMVAEMICYIGRRIKKLSVAGQRVLILSFTQMLGASQDNLSALIKEFFGEDSQLIHIALEGSHQSILQDTVNLLHNLLNLKNVHILQEVYLILLERYEKALGTLADIKPFLEANRFQEKMSKTSAKKMVMFVLAAIGNISTTKGSVLSMWALDPSIFNVLQQYSGLHNTCMAVAHPAIHHSILRLLLLHSSAHNFYQTSSALLGSTTASPTSFHLTNLLTSLSSLITWSSCSPTVKALALKNLSTVLMALKQSADMVVNTEVFNTILRACIKSVAATNRVSKDNLRILLLFVEDFPLMEENIKVIAHVVLNSFQYADESSKALIMRMLSKIPLTMMFDKIDPEVLKTFGLPIDAQISSLEKIIFREYSSDDISAVEVKEFFHFVGGDVKNVALLGSQMFGE